MNGSIDFQSGLHRRYPSTCTGMHRDALGDVPPARLSPLQGCRRSATRHGHP
ncbi:hypothetical protein D779_1511 [Imhoffiella purpurea]|uniref:Uncharacterized protein n=1 Tax=Imhoffiella purpurea TaxID=1249627 RepID=W9V6M1_9GAMM|nr:hypothetical protein D779_1511 [Imhoffiella purpurea]